MSMDEYVVDVDECDQQPYEERDKATSPKSKVGGKTVSKFCNLLQGANQTSNVKSVSRTHEGKSLIMTIARSGKRKRSHTMWVLKIYATFI